MSTKVTKTNVVADIKTAGFDLKLTKDDLFELALEEMITRKQAELEVIKLSVDSLASQLQDAAQARIQAASKFANELPLIATFIKQFPKSNKTREHSLREGNKPGECTGTIELNSGDGNNFHNNSFITLKYTYQDPNHKILVKIREDLDKVNAEKDAIQKDINMLEKSPRKAKVAMLKTMLNGTEAGTNLLAVIKGISIGVDIKALAPVKK